MERPISKISLRLAILAAATLLSLASARAQSCADPNALGVSRVLTVDTSSPVEVGAFNFTKTLPLKDMEVVLTFDDGPLKGVTEQVLAALRNACAKATFFVVGQMATAYPSLVRAELADGHTIASHSNTHPQPISMLSLAGGMSDINAGFAAVAKALGSQPAPFFRFPGFAMTAPLESKLLAANIGIFSTDAMGYDWDVITADQVRQNVLRELAAHRGGIVLLHDIHQRTADMLPQLLKDLKAQGYKLVQVVPAHLCPTAGCRID